MWNKIDCIKIVRAMFGYGLVEAKGIVDRFFEVYSISQINDLSDALLFIRYLKAFKDGKFDISVDGFVIYKRPTHVSFDDIRKASENWV